MGTLRVLIVDEPPDRLPPFGAMLDDLGADVATADSRSGDLIGTLQGEFALILVASPIVSDAGLAAVQLIRSNPTTRHTPLLLIGTPDVDLKALGATPADYLPDQPSPELLRARVRLLLALHAAHDLATTERLAKVAHDLRTPLNAMLGWTSLLRSGRLDAPTAERALETIERNAHVQKDLIAALLDRDSAAQS